MPSRLAFVALFTAGCLWGTGFYFGKIAFREMNVWENVTYRFVIGCLPLLVVFVRHWRRPSWGDAALISLTGAVGVPIQFLVQFRGLQLTTVSHASLIVGTLPVLLAASSAIFLHERLSRKEWSLLFVAAFGALLISVSRPSSAAPPAATQGDLLVFASMLASVIMILTTKRLLEKYEPLFVTAATMCVGTAFLVLFTEATHPVRVHFSSLTWTAVAAQGFLATAGAYIAWTWGLHRVSASRAGVFLNLEPVVGTLLGLLLLHERLGITGALGAALIMVSAFYFTTHPHAQS